jgi:hypothetical protein
VTTRGTDTFVLYVTDYTGVRIYFSCMLLTTLEYGYMCLANVPVLQCSQEQNKTNVAVLQCSQEQNKTNVFLLQCSQEQSKKMYPYSSVVSNLQDKCIRDTFVLYVTDYTGVRIYFSCMLLTTLEYGYMCLVWFVTTLEYGYIYLEPYSSVVRNRTRQMYPYSSVVRNRARQMYPYSSVVSNIQDKCIRTTV